MWIGGRDWCETEVPQLIPSLMAQLPAFTLSSSDDFRASGSYSASMEAITARAGGDRLGLAPRSHVAVGQMAWLGASPTPFFLRPFSLPSPSLSLFSPGVSHQGCVSLRHTDTSLDALSGESVARVLVLCKWAIRRNLQLPHRRRTLLGGKAARLLVRAWRDITSATGIRKQWTLDSSLLSGDGALSGSSSGSHCEDCG